MTPPRTPLADGSISSYMGEPENPSLRKWKQLSIRMTVIHRFSRKYSARSFTAPGLTAASPQRSNTSEGSETRNLCTGTLFSPNTPIQEAPKQKFKSEKRNGEGYSFKLDGTFKDHRGLSPNQILVTGLTSQIEEDDLRGSRIIVTEIELASIQEGTTATDNHIVWTALKGLLFLLWSTLEKSYANAQDDSEDGKRECPNERVDLPYNVQAAAWTFVALIFIIAVIARRINRRPVIRDPVAAPPAVRPPATAPPALPAAAAAPPAVRPPAVAPPALPAAAAAPLAVRPPAAAPPALPAAAAAPPAVPPPAAAPPALPAAAAAPPAAPPLAAAPPALPAAAAAPPPNPNAMGFVNVMDGLGEDHTPARKSDTKFHIHSPVLED